MSNEKMKSGLYDVQDVAIEVAEEISVMLQVDVEMIDCNHMRVAGTGHFKDKINTSNANDGHAYSEVLKTGKKLFVKDPKTNENCEGCIEREHCQVKLEVGAPIILDGKIEGIIGLTCWQEEREVFFLENLDHSIHFLERMCSLVAGKIKERRSIQKNLSTTKILRSLMGVIDKGVIMLDNKGQLYQYNEVAKNELKLTEASKGELINIILTGDTVNEKQEFKVIVGGTVHNVIGHHIKYDDNNGEFSSSILVFNSIREYRNQIYNSMVTVVPKTLDDIKGNSQYVQSLKKKIKKAADITNPILIQGEEGTGKKMVGTAIWKASIRAEKPFVYFNCASIPEGLYEERLFGSGNRAEDIVDGKYMGKIGAIEMANEGILYLDEIDEMPMYYQAKIEEMLEERIIHRSGSFSQIPVDVRVIAATKKNLLKRIEKNKFRKPLYYLLCASLIETYPLRKRSEDIKDLIYDYIEQYAERYRVHIREITPETIEFLERCTWLGNMTELEKTIDHMVSVTPKDGIIRMEQIPIELMQTAEDSEETILSLDEVEMREIAKAMKKFGNSKKGKEQAAEALGIGIATLYRKLERMS